MQASSLAPDGRTSKLRVLVVDNDIEIQELHHALLVGWGYESFIAEGTGDALLQDARAKAQTCRCHVALVDMHLKDDYDVRDWSGIELIRELRPTVSIIVSGSDDRKAAVAALRKYGAFSFVGKEDHPDVLRDTLNEVARVIAAPPHRPKLLWSDSLTSADIVRQLFRHRQDVPGDEVDDVIGRMFHEHQRIVLRPLDDTQDSAKPPSALRRRSRLFLARVDNQRAYRVVKLGHRDKIERELRNYECYVQNELPARLRPEKSGDQLLWDLGGVIYSYAGDFSLGTPETFNSFYRATDTAEHIVQPLRNFFDKRNWGSWYDRKREPLPASLFDAYDEAWGDHLKQSLAAWENGDPRLSFPEIDADLPNPTYWLTQHHHECNLLGETFQVVTHGDLQGDNLFVENDFVLPVDFERTGPGPILRDFVELSQDILTRIAQAELLPLPVLYELAVALCEPRAPNQRMRLTTTIRDCPEARKAFEVVHDLQRLAHDLARYEDRREYLWGLLFNNLFVVTVLEEDNSRRMRTLLLASVICERLEHWNRPTWPPADWPRVVWVDENGSASFTNAHALLIGVGEYAHVPNLHAPQTANDARVLAALLCNRERAGYPAAQVELCVDRDATRDGILDALDALAERIAPDTQVTALIMFAGHGLQIDGRYLLLPHNYDRDKRDTTTIDALTLRGKIDAVARHARNVVILLNCCYSGGFSGMVLDDGAVLSTPPHDVSVLLAEGSDPDSWRSGRIVITSAQPGQRAGTASHIAPEHTVFGAHLLEALHGKAPGRGPTVTVSDLMEYLRIHVPADARQTTDPHTHQSLEQNPEWSMRRTSGDINLTRRPAH